MTLGIATAVPASAADSRAKIVGTDYDQDGNKVILRQGTYNASTEKGFGWIKIQRKHNINDKDTLGFVIHEPYPDYQGETIIEYNAYAQKLIDKKVVDQREVKVVYQRRNAVQYFGVTINGRIGIITAYCENPYEAKRCPDWVDLALGKRVAADARQTETVWTYEPYAVGETIPESEGTSLDGDSTAMSAPTATKSFAAPSPGGDQARYVGTYNAFAVGDTVPESAIKTN